MFQTHLCESQVLGARDLQLVSRRARVYGTATADKDYFRVHHGRLLFGSRLGLVPLDASPQAVVAALQARLAGYFPSLAAIPVARVWSGSLGFSDNGLPRLGPAARCPGAVGTAAAALPRPCSAGGNWQGWRPRPVSPRARNRCNHASAEPARARCGFLKHAGECVIHEYL
nr:FAD-binding oxidoreductase [Pseudomonas sp. BIGb0427]